VYGAFQYITAGGDKDGLDKARKKITGSLIGLVILFSLFAVASLSEVVFGINILKTISIPVI
jgi:hypothetical protein